MILGLMCVNCCKDKFIYSYKHIGFYTCYWIKAALVKEIVSKTSYLLCSMECPKNARHWQRSLDAQNPEHCNLLRAILSVLTGDVAFKNQRLHVRILDMH